jgi:uncharacterized protein (DUF1778 family)
MNPCRSSSYFYSETSLATPLKQLLRRIHTVKYRTKGSPMNTAPTATRFDLKMDAAEKELVSRAAALMGTTMAGFVRSAMKEKAQALLDQEAMLRMSTQDFEQFSQAIQGAFKPNDALQDALNAAAKVQRA